MMHTRSELLEAARRGARLVAGPNTGYAGESVSYGPQGPLDYYCCWQVDGRGPDHRVSTPQVRVER